MNVKKLQQDILVKANFQDTSPTVFSGHGGYKIGNGTTIIPEGTALTVYSKFGSTITDRLGNVVEMHGDTAKFFSRTYNAGDKMPNYTLYPPHNLKIKGMPVIVKQPTLVSDLLKPDMGNCHWAACTYNAKASNSNLMFDTKGILDDASNQWITIYSRILK